MDVTDVQSDKADKRALAVFDFDGTVIDGQSGLLLSRYLYAHKRLSLSNAGRLLWWGIRYKLHLPHRQAEARELVFEPFEGQHKEEVDKVLKRFHEEVLVPKYRKKIVDEVSLRKSEGCVCLLISATFSSIAEAAAKRLKCDDFVATDMKVDDAGCYTLHVDGPVIEGNAKLQAAQLWADEHLGKDRWYLAYGYGDHHSDEELLGAADLPFAVNPGKTLRRFAKRVGWTIIDTDASDKEHV
ncbi:MAG: haloacid dehalogenase-like hydrolase [Atopobiaceae bacterium]|nr:haloacid dehalogenase-like hydrolase [Atopobiaceae bacterium]